MRERYEAAVDEIIEDIMSRQGIGPEWESIDEEIKSEIREEWIRTIERNMNQWLS